MELRDYLAIARKWLWLFALATAIAAAGAWLATKAMPKQFASQTTVLVGRTTESAEPDWQSFYMAQNLAGAYARMATREPVLQRVVEALELPMSWQALRGMVQAREVPGSPLIEIRIIDTDIVRAQILAEAVAMQLIAAGPGQDQGGGESDASFVQSQIDQLEASIVEAERQIEEIDTQIAVQASARTIADLQARKAALDSKKDTWQARHAQLYSSLKGGPVNSLSILEKAVPGYQVGPNVKMNVLFAAVLGFGLALAAVLLLEYLDDTIKTTDDAEKRLGLPGLATINRVPGATTRKEVMVTVHRPRSPIAEAFRVLRTNLQFSFLSNPHGALVVTSPNPGEGKSTTAANLAVVVAQRGKRTILVDSDLRRPALHRFFGCPNSVGLTSLLLDEDLAPDDALQDIDGVPGLRLVTSGPLPPNPAEVLESSQMQRLLADLRERAELVVLDSPPVLVVADAAILASHADGTLLVTDSGVTRTHAARDAVATLAKVGVKPVGVVVNKLDPERIGGRYYAYSYRYRYGHYYGKYYGRADGTDHGGYYGDYYSDHQVERGADGEADGAGTDSNGAERPAAIAPRAANAIRRIMDGLASLLS